MIRDRLAYSLGHEEPAMGAASTSCAACSTTKSPITSRTARIPVSESRWRSGERARCACGRTTCSIRIRCVSRVFQTRTSSNAVGARRAINLREDIVRQVTNGVAMHHLIASDALSATSISKGMANALPAYHRSKLQSVWSWSKLLADARSAASGSS